MNATDDSVPELAQAIRSLINSKPSSPTQGELEKVIRDHVAEQMQLVFGGPIYGDPNVPSSGSVFTTITGTGQQTWAATNMQKFDDGA